MPEILSITIVGMDVVELSKSDDIYRVRWHTQDRQEEETFDYRDEAYKEYLDIVKEFLD